MIDRAKILQGLEHCVSDDHPCVDCPYKEKCIREGWIVSLQKDALELLKEQEAQIERLEHDLAVTQNNLNYYVNGND